MSKINIKDMSYYYADFYNPVFEQVNLVLDTDWKLGLIGRNGRGKTTLLRLLRGDLKCSSGTICVPGKMGFFPYPVNLTYKTVLDVIKENAGGFKTMEDTMEEIISQEDAKRYDEYCTVMTQYAELGGYSLETEIAKEMVKMNLDKSLLEREYATLSGGEKTKMMMLALFLRKDDFVLLDEPTNHLDTKGKKTMASYLSGKKGFIVVSHDGAFLDQVIDHVLSINKTEIALEQGNYSSWLTNQQQTEQFELRTRQHLSAEIKKLEQQADKNSEWASFGNTQKYEFKSNSRANGAKSYMRQARRSKEQAQDDLQKKQELLNKLEEERELFIRQEESAEGWLIKVEDLSFGYCNKQIVEEFQLTIYPNERIWIQGANGAGKSTLLKLLGKELESEAVQYAEAIRVAKAYQEPLWEQGYLTTLLAKRWQQEQSKKQWMERFLELCSCFELPKDFMLRPLETYSSGERKKTDIARALSEQNHLVLLDEPLNFMDTCFRRQLEEAILSCQPTMIFVEHDAWFGNKVATRLINL